ncbi:MAG: DEAD/DEAH box helicase [Planctomycetota bacterium]
MAAGFDRFDLSPELLRAVADAGFTEPRPIQDKALPHALAGRDVLGLAQTGTGKTAAFLLPILERLRLGGGKGPRALIVAPTRELASQIHEECRRLARHTPLESIAIFGGVPIQRQLRALRGSPAIVVACPGRLLDLLDRRALRLDRIETLVLDEADHMFDMGFLPSIRRIVAALPRERQNLLFSATMPTEIRKLAERLLHDPVRVELPSAGPNERIAHVVVPVGEQGKDAMVEQLIGDGSFRSAIVFLRTKRRVKSLTQRLARGGHSAVGLQGNMSQGQRERALAGFRAGRYDVLVATDIAARGIDVAGVSHVINYDLPSTPDAYVHRIGRTGRAGLEGRACTFVTNEDRSSLRAIEKHLGAPIEREGAAPIDGEERRRARGATADGPSADARRTEPARRRSRRRAKARRGRGSVEGSPRTARR